MSVSLLNPALSIVCLTNSIDYRFGLIAGSQPCILEKEELCESLLCEPTLERLATIRCFQRIVLGNLVIKLYE